MPADIQLGTISLQVANLGVSLSFYEQFLGFHVLQRSHGVAHLGVGRSTAVLLSLHEKPGVLPVPRRGLLGLYHFALLLPSRADLARFVRHCIESQVHFGSADHLISEALYLTDPDGITMEVYRDRARPEWQVTPAGEILATIDPLDVDGLADVGRDVSWNGLPPSTKVGHVHFYVNDLDAAASFYHAGLGFDKVLWTLPGALFVSAGLYHHHVGLNTWAAGSRIATEDDARLLSWELLLPDEDTLQAAVDSLRRTVHPVTTYENGYRACDTWGNAVLLRLAE